MTETDKAQILVALQNGIGLTVACEFCLLSVKSVSEVMRKDLDFMAKCRRAVKAAATANLEFAQRLKNEKKFNEWHRQQTIIKNFISDITLWEEYSKRKDVDEKVVSRAVVIYKTIGECATSLGYSKKEFVEYAMSKPKLSMYLQTSGKYNF